MDKNAKKTIQEAFQHFKKGALDGEWDGYLNYFAEDASYWGPVPGKFLGENKGREKIRAFYESQTANGVKLKAEDPFNIITEGKKVFIEYHESGTVGGNPFKNIVALSYIVEDGKIIDCREYLGDLSPFVPQ